MITQVHKLAEAIVNLSGLNRTPQSDHAAGELQDCMGSPELYRNGGELGRVVCTREKRWHFLDRDGLRDVFDCDGGCSVYGCVNLQDLLLENLICM